MPDRRKPNLDSTCSDDDPSGTGWRAERPSTALAIVWSAEEPERVGEVAFIAGGTPGPEQVLGRGEATDADPHGRLAFARIRGGHVEPQPALRTSSLSRVQLRVRMADDGWLDVENTGRLRLTEKARSLRLRPGDTMQLGGQLLFLVLQRPLPASRLEHDTHVASDFPYGTSDANGIVGESAAAWTLRERIAFVGARRGHVLVHGPSGSGKELVARAIHAASDRYERPLISRNAATIPEGLVDAELFGNIRNYPNAGSPERQGLVGEADGTSLFLDEFGELPLSAQAHLLRVLDSGEYQRLGEARPRRSNFRLLAATNREPSSLREDVLGRMALQIEVPGLDGRREDVPLLVRHLLRRMLSDDQALARRFPEPPSPSLALVHQLVVHDFVAHAREIEQILWRALESSRSGVLEPLLMSPRGATTPAATHGVPRHLDDQEIPPAVVQQCLDAHNGSIEETWPALGLSSRYVLARLIRKHQLEVRKRARR